jgi:glycosyltransferase involved in cell wall biosynthesis
MSDRMKVCLILEGSYPYITGGVSSWVHQLILELKDIDFVLYTISPKSNQPVRYIPPKNVVEHKDIVIGDKLKSRRKPKNKKKMFNLIKKIHMHMKSGSTPHIDELIQQMPSEYFLYSDAVKTDTGWEMIVSGNKKHNPIYPFSEYFWAWKGSHDMMFTVIGDTILEADIYHAISTGYAGLAAVTAKIRTGKPFILTEHGLYHKEREMEIRRSDFIRGYQRTMWINIFNTLSKICYKYADLIISLFEFNRRLQIELGAPQNKTMVIPNGIDTDRFSSINRVKRKIFKVGLVGRVVPIKDIKTFIITSKIISEMIPGTRFYCIGPTDEEPSYYNDCKLLVNSFQLQERFIFTGRQDVRIYYSLLDVLLLTSVREAQPLVILEAFCAGIPVVATKVGNVPELLDYDERFLAASKDASKLAQGVKYIYENPQEMEQLVNKNKKKVLSFYNRKKIHNQYREIYRDFYSKNIK